MDYSSNYQPNCIKLRELCIPLYCNYLLKHKKFPVTKFTPRKKGSGIVYYIKLTGDLGITGDLTNYNSNKPDKLNVLSGTSSSYNSNNNQTNSMLTSSSYNINKVTVANVLSGDNASYINSNNNTDIDDILTSPVLSGDNASSIYKIGYTSRTIAHRLTTMEVPANIKVTIIATLKFNKLTDAYNMEQVLHKEYKYGRYYGKLLGNGNSELYGSDVLGLVYS